MTTRLANFGLRHMLLMLSLAISLLASSGCRRASTTPDSSVTFGKLVTAANVDANNAPTALADTFSPSQKTIFVVAEAQQIAPGTRIAATWTRDGTPIEVSDEVIATQGYHNTNIEFHLTSGTNGFAPGNYKVQLIVNGTPGPSARYTFR